MTARKCDRCGGFYELKSAGAEIRFIFPTTQSLYRDFDICPDCKKEFDMWMKNEADFCERRPEE